MEQLLLCLTDVCEITWSSFGDASRGEPNWQPPRVGVRATSTHLLDDRENPRLAVVIAVRADSEVDLVGVGIGLEGSGKLEDPATRRSALRRREGGQMRGRVRIGGREGDLRPTFCMATIEVNT